MRFLWDRWEDNEDDKSAWNEYIKDQYSCCFPSTNLFCRIIVKNKIVPLNG